MTSLPLVLLACFFLLHLFALAGATATGVEVEITFVSGQSFGFDTGLGLVDINPLPPTVSIEVFDKCRTESPDRILVGALYPISSVEGLQTDYSGLTNLPGTGNSMSFSFVEGIGQNIDVYTDNGDNTGSVEFCVQVNLVVGDIVANFAEVKLTYNINLETDVALPPQRSSLLDASDLIPETAAPTTEVLETPAPTSNTDAAEAYFCDPNTRQKLDQESYEVAVIEETPLHLCLGGEYASQTVTSIRIEENGTIVEEASGAVLETAHLTCTHSIACVLSLAWDDNFYTAGLATLDDDSEHSSAGSVIVVEFQNSTRRFLRGNDIKVTPSSSSSSSVVSRLSSFFFASTQ